MKKNNNNNNFSTDALYDWLVRGSNAGVRADVEVGPTRLSSNVGFAIKNANQPQVIGGRLIFQSVKHTETPLMSIFLIP